MDGNRIEERAREQLAQLRRDADWYERQRKQRAEGLGGLTLEVAIESAARFATLRDECRFAIRIVEEVLEDPPAPEMQFEAPGEWVEAFGR